MMRRCYEPGPTFTPTAQKASRYASHQYANFLADMGERPEGCTLGQAIRVITNRGTLPGKPLKNK